MAFWNVILVFILLLIIPSIMIVYGAYVRYNTLRGRETIISYRSKRARLSEKHWARANGFFGSFMFWWGFGLFLGAFVAAWICNMFHVLGTYSATVIVLIEAIVFMSCFYLTELYLKRTAMRDDGKDE